ncbi:MAG: hypothetical protein E7265_05185 [Lachnospiraceae bacterium]|nr:hypothetical protein [Lachnospiraceae bacterium]
MKNMFSVKRTKRSVAWLMAIVMLFTMVIYVPSDAQVYAASPEWNGYVATSYDAGKGTKENPYQIRWGSQLAYLAENVNNGETYENTYFVLTGDIVLNSVDGSSWELWDNQSSGLKDWEAIGYYNSADDKCAFAGNFDGEGHTISGMYTCNKLTNGLFGYNTGVIKNVNIEKSYIEGSGYGVGGIAGKNDGTVTNCHNSATISSVWLDSNNYEAGSVGGVVGTNGGFVSYSYNDGRVDGVGVTGGVAGTNNNLVVNCYNTGNIGLGITSQYGTGGVVGCNSKDSSVVENSYNRGNVNATNYAGGIVGTNVGSAVNCYNTGDVTVAQSGGYAGAIAGALERTNFDYSGQISYSYWDQALGMEAVGYAGRDGVVSANCYRYDDTLDLFDVDGFPVTVEFSIDNATVDADKLDKALDSWTQAKNCGAKEAGIARWTVKDDLPVFADKEVTIWSGNASSAYGGGDGTQGSPYRITNGDQLKYFANQVNGGNSYNGDYFVLATDIILNDETFEFDEDTGLIQVTDGINTGYYGTGIKGTSGGNTQFDNTASVKGTWYRFDGFDYSAGSYTGEINGWTPIGSSNKHFAGNFLGKGYTISGLFVENYMYSGLFGYVSGSNISDVNVNNVFAITSDTGYMGSISGYYEGKLSGCTAEGAVLIATEEGYVGGITGYVADAAEQEVHNKISGSDFEGFIYGCGYAGGITGYSGYGNYIDECYTHEGSVIRCNGTAAGGICGRNYGSFILNSYNHAKVVSEAVEVSYVGGIAGENVSEGVSCIEGFADVFGKIHNCYNRGVITGAAASYAGGIAGYNLGGEIKNVYSEASVSGGTVGSIAGVNGITDGEYILYEGLTRQKYKNTFGTIDYGFYSSGIACGADKCNESGSGQYVTNTFQFSTSSGSKYSFSHSVLASQVLDKAMNAWITTEGLGSDKNKQVYLGWVYTNGSYPKFTGTHSQEITDTEPYPKYTLHYDSNCTEAVGTMEDEIYELTLPGTGEADKPVVKDIQFTREGYNFVEWNTAVDEEGNGIGSSYAPGETIIIDSNITLYAIWVSTQAVITSATRDGVTATIEWSTVDDAVGYWVYRYKLDSVNALPREFTSDDKIGEVVSDGIQTSYTYVDENLEAGAYCYGIRAYSNSDNGVTATYVFKPFSEPAKVVVSSNTITYDGNGSTVGSNSDEIWINGTDATIAESGYTNAGYSFAGWNTQQDGNGTTYKPGDIFTIEEDMTLYAMWKLAPVEDLTASLTDNDMVLLTWSANAAPEANGYNVYCSKGDNSNYELIGVVPKGSASTLRYVTDKTEASTKYYYIVRTYRDSAFGTGTYTEESDDGEEVYVETDAMVMLDKTKGENVDGAYTGIDGEKVFLKWEVGTGVTGYELYRSTKEDEFGSKVATVTGSTNNTYVDTVPYEGTFYYRVRSYTETKNVTTGQISNVSYSSYSRKLPVAIETIIVEFNSNVKDNIQIRPQTTGRKFVFKLNKNMYTNPGFEFVGWNTKPDRSGVSYTDEEECCFKESITLYAVWKLDKPLNLAAEILDGSLLLSWDANPSASGYEIFQKEDAGTYKLLDTVVSLDGQMKGQYTIKNFDMSIPYYYYIRAYVNAEVAPDAERYVIEYSDNSEVIKVAPTEVPDGQPQNVTAQINPDGQNGSQVKLTWNAVTDAAGYHVYRSAELGKYGRKVGDVRGTEFIDESVDPLMPGDYYYYVRSYTEDDMGVYYKNFSKECKVTFDRIRIIYKPNGGDGEEIVENVIKGASGVQVKDCVFARENFRFAEWYGNRDDVEITYDVDIDDEGNNEIFAASVLDKDMILNARWKLESVTEVTAVRNSDNTVSISWTGNSLASGYDVYQKKGVNGTFDKVLSTSTTKCVTPEIDNTSIYYYYIIPYEDVQLSSGILKSEGIPSETVIIEPEYDTIQEGQVTGLSAVIENTGAVKLSWDKVNQDEVDRQISGYCIYRTKEEGARGACIATVESIDEISYLDTDEFGVGKYYYSVRAYVATENATFYLPWSESIEVEFANCSITYVANNMTDETTIDKHLIGVDVEAISNPFIYSGRTFVSWNTDPLGKGYEYFAGDTYRIDEDITLYAIWKLDKPANVVATLDDNKTAVTLTWDKIIGADGYLVCRRSTDSEEIEERGTVTDTSYVDDNGGVVIGDNSGYYYFVRAYEIIDESTRRFSDYSDTTRTSVIGNAIEELPAPVGTPTNLTILNFNEDTARIGWSGVPAADGYFVYYSIGEDGEKIYTGNNVIGSNITTGKLALDTPYYYYIVAYIMDSVSHSCIMGNYSEGLKVMMTSSPAPSPSPTPIPSATPNPYGKVNNFEADVDEENLSAELSWDDIGGMSGYHVYSADNEAGDNMVLCKEVSGTALTVNNLEKDKTYYYMVRGYVAKVGVGYIYSEMSDVVQILIESPKPTQTPEPTNTPTPTAVPTAVPTNSPKPTATPTKTPKPTVKPTQTPAPTETNMFLVSNAYGKFIDFIWNQVTGATGYEISYSTSQDGEKQIVAVCDKDATTLNAVEVSGAAFTINRNINASNIQAYNQYENASYYYFIRAIFEDGFGDYSKSIKVELHAHDYATPSPSPTGAVPTVAPTRKPEGTDKYAKNAIVKKSKLVYKVTKNSGKNRTVEVVKPVKKTYTSITIPATITAGGKKFKVTSIKANAFKGNKKLKSVVIGANVKKIGKKTFYNCGKLAKIRFKGKQITSIGSKAFRGTKKKCKMVIPKSAYKKYKKLINKAK